MNNVIVRVDNVEYRLNIHSKISIILGDSGTGKSVLVDAIAYNYRHNLRSSNSSNGEGKNRSDVESNKRCVGIWDGADWASIMDKENDSIIFIDETFEDIYSKEFAVAVNNSNNQFVFVTRQPLCCLSYGYYDIFNIKNKNGISTLSRAYDIELKNIDIDMILTEDSGSGYQFISRFAKRYGIDTDSCGGNANIYKYIDKYKNTGKNILVIADGAGIGCHIEKILNSLNGSDNISLWLPESFEWLLLHSVVFETGNNTLKNTLNNIRSVSGKAYMNAETFCTKLIKKLSENTPYEYSKSSCRKCYTSSCMKCKGYDKCKYKTPHTTSAKLLSVMCMYKYIDEIVKKDKEFANIIRAAEADYINTCIKDRKE